LERARQLSFSSNIESFDFLVFSRNFRVCAKVWALDMSFHQYGSSRDYTDEINALVASANEAVALNTDRYGQLALLVNQFKSAVENRDRRQLLDLVAVEGECENLGFGMNE